MRILQGPRALACRSSVHGELRVYLPGVTIGPVWFRRTCPVRNGARIPLREPRLFHDVGVPPEGSCAVRSCADRCNAGPTRRGPCRPAGPLQIAHHVSGGVNDLDLYRPFGRGLQRIVHEGSLAMNKAIRATRREELHVRVRRRLAPPSARAARCRQECKSLVHTWRRQDHGIASAPQPKSSCACGSPVCRGFQCAPSSGEV